MSGRLVQSVHMCSAVRMSVWCVRVVYMSVCVFCVCVCALRCWKLNRASCKEEMRGRRVRVCVYVSQTSRLNAKRLVPFIPPPVPKPIPPQGPTAPELHSIAQLIPRYMWKENPRLISALVWLLINS